MTTNTETAVTFVTGNQIEITRASVVRRLIASKNQYKLIIVDEHSQPWVCVIDADPFIKEYEERYGVNENPMDHQALISTALYRAVMNGSVFKVIGKTSLLPDLTE